MKQFDYLNLRNKYEREFARKIKEWNGLYMSHLILNQKLDELFKEIDNKKELSDKELLDYLSIRTKNDKINSGFKIISTETNAIWIKIQELDLEILESGKVNPIFIGIDKENGRLRYYLDFKEEL